MVGNWDSQPKARTLSLADGQIKVACLPITHWWETVMEPEMPLMRVDVGVSGGELVPSNQVSLLNMCRLAPESKTQRDKVELSFGNLIALICESLSSLSSSV